MGRAHAVPLENVTEASLWKPYSDQLSDWVHFNWRERVTEEQDEVKGEKLLDLYSMPNQWNRYTKYLSTDQEQNFSSKKFSHRSDTEYSVTSLEIHYVSDKHYWICHVSDPHGGYNMCCVQKSSVQNCSSFITMVLYQVSLILSLQIFKIFLTE